MAIILYRKINKNRFERQTLQGTHFIRNVLTNTKEEVEVLCWRSANLGFLCDWLN